jgi:hypothetical protein
MLVLDQSRGSSSPALVGERDLRGGPLPAALAPHRPALEEAARWARSYLCEPHAALGREGPVCPYAGPSLKRELFWLAVATGVPAEDDGVAAVVREYRDWFARLAPVDGHDTQYKAVLVLFPELPAERVGGLLDSVQVALKPEFVADGLMVGQFHASCGEAGLWNSTFRPMRSRVPLIAIRTMVRSDAPFLVDSAHSLAAYLRRFGDDVPARLRPAVQAAARRFGVAYTAA